MNTRSLRGFLLGLMLGLCACTGAIDDPNALRPTGGQADNGALTGAGGVAAIGAGSGVSMTSSALACKDKPVDPGPAPMRLLSQTQYLNTVRDLFGDIPALQGVLDDENQTTALGIAQGDATQVQVEQYQTAAGLISATVVADASKLKQVAPCVGSDQRACAGDLVESFGARAYRAPVTDAADIERHLALYDVGAKSSHAHGIELLLNGMLQSPRFLYRVEVGTTEKVSVNAVKLSGHEVAARLSYSLWNTLPDATLTRAAEAGKLDTADGVAAQLDYVLKDPRGKTVVSRFLAQWLQLGQLSGLVKDATMYPEWTSKKRPMSLYAQAVAFFDYVLSSEGGKLSALLTSPKVLVNQDVADYYGVTSSAAFTPIDVSNVATSGILTLPAFLAIEAKPSESSPIYRGKFVREQLLCQELPAPPPNIPKAPDVQAGVSTRERLKQHEVDPSCSGCHTLMDPLGFGFENFDAVGRYRTQDGTQHVDASGAVNGSADADGNFHGVVELGQKLAGSLQVQDCMARQWFRFALSRYEQDVDVCSMQSLRDAFQNGGASLNTLPQAVVGTSAFMYRRPLDWKVSP